MTSNFTGKSYYASAGALLLFILGVSIAGGTVPRASAATAASVTLPLMYSFNVAGIIDKATSKDTSTSPYWWVTSGAPLTIANGIGTTPIGTQSIFQMFLRYSIENSSAQIYFNRLKDNLSNTSNRHAYNGESILVRYQDQNNYYYAGLRADGDAVIKKKKNGVYQTLASKEVFAGTYDEKAGTSLIPLKKWIGLKLTITNNGGVPTLSLYTDVGQTGSWKLAVSAIDDPAKFGSAVTGAGLVGVQSDYADVQFDSFYLTSEGAAPAPTPMPTPDPAPTPSPTTSYDSLILDDKPIMYLAMSAASAQESDKTGRGHTGTYKGGTPLTSTLPNGEKAANFNGSSQYLTVPSSADLSIPTTRSLTWEAWIRPETLQFPKASGDGYIDWMGKCQNYSPTCEWEARMYNSTTAESRPNRISAYVFNSGAGLGSAADWQPSANTVKVGEWLHIVAEYQTITTPSGCSSQYPGSINIWVNGVKQNFAAHVPTGCMSQFKIIPKASNSPLNIGTMAMDTWFKGAVGKVAVYDRLLTQSEINEHFKAMTGKDPSGSCADTCTF